MDEETIRRIDAQINSTIWVGGILSCLNIIAAVYLISIEIAKGGV